MTLGIHYTDVLLKGAVSGWTVRINVQKEIETKMSY